MNYVQVSVLTIVASLQLPATGRLVYRKKVPMENVVWSENDFLRDSPVYVFMVNGNPKAALLMNGNESNVATRMIYDTSNVQDTTDYFPPFRALIYNHVKEIDITRLSDDERIQFLML